MNVSNHAATGALIALAVPHPVIALPLAFASHFALDALPHFGFEKPGYIEAFKHRITYLEEIINICLIVLLVVTLRHQAAWIFVAAFLACSPDLRWPYNYFVYEHRGREAPIDLFSRLHKVVQWCERPWGLLVEIGWFALIFTLLVRVV